MGRRLAFLLPLLLFLFIGNNVLATRLTTGDVAVTSVNSDGNDSISFVLLTDVLDSVRLYITDNGWDVSSSDWYNTTEGTIEWKYIGNLSCGTQISIDISAGTSNYGTIDETGSMNLSAAGDALLFYNEICTEGCYIEWVHGFNYSSGGWVTSPASTSESSLPSALTNGVNAVAMLSHKDNWTFNCDGLTASNSVESREDLNNASYWTGHNTTIYSPPTCWFPCGQSGAVAFDGSSDRAIFTGDYYSGYTIETWVRFTGSTINKSVVAGSNGVPMFSLTNQIRTNGSGQFYHATYDGSAKHSHGTTVIQQNEWYHVAITAQENDSTRMYVNGQPEGAVHSIGSSLWTLLTTYHIGQQTKANSGYGTGAGDLEGEVDELRVWKYARSQAEIQSTMYCELTGSEDSLVTYFNFNNVNAQPYGNNSSDSIIVDLTSSGWNAEMFNFDRLDSASNWVFGCDSVNAYSCLPSSYSFSEYPSRPGAGHTLKFDGVDGHALSTTSTLGGTSTSDSLTLEFWVNTTYAGVWETLFNNESSTGASLRTMLHYGKPRMTIVDSSGASIIVETVSDTVNDGKWHHVAYVYNGAETQSGISIYIDGVSVSRTPQSNTFAYTGVFGDTLHIGFSAQGTHANHGNIDEVRFWNAALDSTTIRTWMCRKLDSTHGDFASIKSYYRFDIGYGNMLYDIVGSGNASLVDLNTTTAWTLSGAAIGDNSAFTYGGSSVTLTQTNGTSTTINDFDAGIIGAHLYTVNESPNTVAGVTGMDTTGYTGVFKVGTGSYDVTLGYSGNASIAGTLGEGRARVFKRDNNATTDWIMAGGVWSVDTANDQITIPNQTGTEYVIGFANATYPSRPGSGYALDFDGVDDYVKVPVSGISQLSSQFTMEMWVKVDDISNFPWMLSFTGSQWGHIESDGDVRQRIITSDGNQYQSNIPFGFVTGEWIHFAMTYDGSDTRYYKNGSLTATVSTTGDLIAGQNRFEIGTIDSASLYMFDGQLDEIRIWTSVLDSTLIRDWMCRKLDTSHSKIDSLFSYYRFDEGASDTLYDLKSGNNGAFQNMNAASDWQLSGAALGDMSAYTYGGDTLQIAHSDGDYLEITNFSSGSPAFHAYVVNEAPNTTGLTSGLSSYDTSRYYGVFNAGSGSYVPRYFYGNNPNIGGNYYESYATLVERDDNADQTWSQMFAVNNTDSQLIRELSFQVNTEYMPGFETLPGGALHFDGTNDYVTINDFNWPAGTGQPITISFWMNRSGTLNDDIVLSAASNAFAGTNRLYVSHATNSTLVFQYGSLKKTTPLNFATTGVWTHVTLTADPVADEMKFYIDGVLTSSYTDEFDAPSIGRDSITLGTSPEYTKYFDGTIDELRIWNRVLCPSEIQQTMNCEILPSELGLFAYYSFNTPSSEAAGSNAGIDSVVNQVGSGKTGQLLNFGLSSGTSNWVLQSDSVTTTCDSLSSPYLAVVYGGNAIQTGATVIADSLGNDFGETTIGLAKQKTYQLVNLGLDTVQISSTSATGAFSVDSVTTTILPGDTGILTVVFSPTSSLHFDDVTIVSNACTDFQFVVQGRGVDNLAGAGYSLDFDGVDDRVSVPSGASNQLSTEWTIQLWVRPDPGYGTFSVGHTDLVSKWGASGTDSASYLVAFNTSGQIQAQLHNGSTSTSLSGSTTIPTNRWSHVAVTRESSGKLTIYYNGLVDATVASSVVPQSSIYDLTFGDESIGGNNYSGRLDEITLWNTALDSNSIRSWMCKKIDSSHSSFNSLQAYYRFDDGQGIGLRDYVGTNGGLLIGMDPATDWVYSGAALGDESVTNYPAALSTVAMANNNVITIDGFAGTPDGVHVYVIGDTAVGSTYPTSLASADSVEYFGVFMVGGTSYDVTIDYTNNAGIEGNIYEDRVRGLKRSGGDDAEWEIATGALRLNIDSNTILIPNQSGTEYVTGFYNSTYPVRAGSGNTVEFSNFQYAQIPNDTIFSVDAVTIETWVLWKSALDTIDFICAKGYEQLELHTGGDAGNNSIRFIPTSNVWLDAPVGSFLPDEWNHVACVYDPANSVAKIFINGVDVDVTNSGSNPITTPLGTSASDYYIGLRSTGAFPFNGNIDEFRMWAAALDSTTIRTWMCQKINASHDSIDNLIAYYRFDEAAASSLIDLASGQDGSLQSFTPATDWVNSGAALGDYSVFEYPGSTITDTLSNANVVSVSGLEGAPDGLHYYVVTDTATGSGYPGTIYNVDSTEYFGVFMVGGESYDVTIDYSNNSSLASAVNEAAIRGLKRSGGDASNWSQATGFFDIDTANNQLNILNQSGTEYVTGFTNAVYPVRPGAGYALDFDGVNDRLDVPDDNSLDLVDRITLEAWIKRGSTNTQDGIIEKYRQFTTGQGGYAFRVTNTNKLSFGTINQSLEQSLVGTTDIIADEWMHVAVTYNAAADSVRMYINGVLEAESSTHTLVPLPSDLPLRIGARGDDATHPFHGTLDEIRIWNAELDSTLIRQWMTKKINASHDSIGNLVSYYRFDDGAGDVLADLGTGNNGVLLNMDTLTDWVYSGAALGDENMVAYPASGLSDTLSNGNVISVDGLEGSPEGLHLYLVNDTAVGSTYPAFVNSADSTQYFGVYMVGGASYDVSIDYGANALLNGTWNEARIKALKRSGGDDADWNLATGELSLDSATNMVTIQNQTGTEYVTAFSNNAYPTRPGAGYALDFDGVDDQIYIGDVLPDSGSFTASTWFKSHAVPAIQEGLFVRGLDGSGNGWSVAIFYRSDSSLMGAIVNSSGSQISAIGTTKVLPYEWHHTALTFDSASGDLTLYLDGQIEATANTTNNQLRTSTFGSFIGRGNLVSEAFDGELDEHAIWNSALDSTEVRQWMCRKMDTSHTSFGSLMAYYRFDEGAGDTLFDLSGGNTGPLANMASTAWKWSGAAIGDTSIYSYTGDPLTLSAPNGNQSTVSNYSSGVNGMHMYRVDESPNSLTGSQSADASGYVGVFKVGADAETYDVAIDYEQNGGVTSGELSRLRLYKRSGGDEDWNLATGVLRNDEEAMVVSLPNQTGTEYVTGFATSAYPSRPGSGNGLTLDGTNDYIEADTMSNQPVGDDARTVEAWFSSTASAGTESIINFGDASATQSTRFALRLNAGASIGVDIGGRARYYSAAVGDGRWHHVAAVMEEGDQLNEIEVYLDGTLLTTLYNGIGSQTAIPNTTLANTLIGRNVAGNVNYEGSLDEIRVWNTTLDSTQIRQWMCRKLDTSHGSINNLLAYYRFDEGSGDTLFDLAGGNTGVLHNFGAAPWGYSGAALGDESAFAYPTDEVKLWHPDGDTMTVSVASGSPDGIHIYRVDEAPNDTASPYTMSFLDTTHYYGVFMAGDTTAAFNAELDYTFNYGYVSYPSAGQGLQFAGRGNNADLPWVSKSSPLFTNNMANFKLTMLYQPSGTELIVGESRLLRPAGSGYALDFDGIDDRVEIPYDSDLDFGTGSFAIESWVRFDTAQADLYPMITGWRTNASNGFLFYANPSGNLSSVMGAGVYQSSTNVVDGRWHHVAFSRDGTACALYVDGVEALTFTSAQDVSVTAPRYIGHEAVNPSNSIFHGNIDEVRYWNTSLDTTLLRQWMCRKIDSTHSNLFNLVSYYRFDQQGDTTLFDLFRANHGELQNMDASTDWVYSGAALGDNSVNSYAGLDIGLEHEDFDSMAVFNYDGQLDGIHLYVVNEESNTDRFHAADAVHTNYYYGVYKVGADSTEYDVYYYYGNAPVLYGASNEYRVALAKRENNADTNWLNSWFGGQVDEASNSLILRNQTGTEYAGIVSSNNALALDGVNDFVQVQSSSSINLTTEWTIEGWFNPSGLAGYRALVSKGVTNRPASLWQNGSKAEIWFNPSASAVLVSNANLTIGDWVHLAATFDNGEVKLYVNGVLDNSTNVSITPTTNTSDYYLGQRGDNTLHFNGEMDEIRIWDRTLCEDEVLAHVNCQFDSIAASNLLMYYSFDQGIGDSVNTGLDSLIDLSGNGLNGTLSNLALIGSTSNWVVGNSPLTGACDPYLAPTVYVISEGDTIVSGDTIATVLDSTDFGNVILNQNYTVTYGIYNGGVGVLDIDTVSFATLDSSFFSVTYPDSLIAGDTGLIVVTVNASIPDSIATILRINTNDCGNSPYEFRIQGNVYGNAGALMFDGVDDYVNVSDTIGYVGMKELTVEAWIKVDTSTGTLQSIMSATGTEFTHFQTSSSGSDNNVFYTNNGIVSLPVFPEAPFDQWRHVALVAKSGDSKVFIDGSQYGAGNTLAFDSILVTNNIRIGSGFGASRFFDGEIDELRVWDRALDSNEIKAGMSCQLDGNECGLLAYYNFNNDSAYSYAVNTSLTTLGDSSTNGHNGTLIGFGSLNTDSSNWVPQTDSVSGYCSVSDVVPPVVIPVETHEIVYFGSPVTLNAALIDSATCDYYSGVDSLWVVPITVNCSNHGDTAYLFAQDSVGLIDSASFILSVVDSAPPVVVAGFDTVYLNANGVGYPVADSLDFGSFDDCGGPVTLALSLDSVQCADLTASGDSLDVILTVADSNGNSASDTAKLIVLDTVAPTVITQDTFVNLDSNGQFVITVAHIDSASLDNCGIDSMWVGNPNVSCVDTSAYVAWLVVRDSSGNVDSSFANVQVIDNIAPYLNLETKTYALDSSGGLSISYYDLIDLSATSFDNCSDTSQISYSLSLSSFSCSDTGVNEVIVTGVDEAGNTNVDTTTVTVIDTIRPIVVPRNLTVYLGVSGTVSIAADTIDSNSTDNCSIDAIWLSDTLFECADTVGQTITLYVQDVNGNVDSALSVISVVDTVRPQLSAVNDTAYLDASGAISLDTTNYFDITVSDNCLMDTVYLDNTAFVCADTGVNSVKIFAEDASGNLDSVTVSLTIMDTIPPAFILLDTILYLNASGSASLPDSSVLFDVVNDNCTVDSLIVTGQTTFGCNETIDSMQCSTHSLDFDGTNDVVVIGPSYPNQPLGSAARTVEAWIKTSDITAQGVFGYGQGGGANRRSFSMIVQQDQLKLAIRGSTYIADALNITDGNWHHIAISYAAGVTINQADFYMDGQLLTTGSGDVNTPNTQNGNMYIGTRETNNTNFDGNISEVRLWNVARDSNQIATYYNECLTGDEPGLIGFWKLDDGTGTIASNEVAGGSDGTLTNMTTSDWTTDVPNQKIGVPVSVYAVDGSGNSTYDTAYVRVLDTLPPVVISQNDTVYLDTAGMASIDTGDVNNGSSDNCAIDSVWLSDSSFTCADTVGQTIMLYVQDVNGNLDSATSLITVLDTVNPVVSTLPVTIYLDSNGMASILPDTLDNGSSDNCAIDTMWLSQSSFTCADTNGVVDTLFVRDVSGNVSSQTAVVTIEDTLIPIISVVNDTIYLNTAGVATLDTSMVDNGTSDNCEIDSIWLSQTTFNCSDTNFANPVTFFARDISGNLDSAVITVIVVDTVLPTILTKNDTVYLDTLGNVTIDTLNVNNGSNDNCLLDSLWLSAYSFSCADTNDTVIKLYGRDLSGNVDSATATITIIDNIIPTIAIAPVTAYLDSNGLVSITADTVDVGTSDNCAVDSIWLSNYDYTCADTAALDTITFYARDISGNIDSAQTTVTVLDTQPAVVIPRNLTVYLGASGGVSITADTIDSASTDNCTIDSIWLSDTAFVCADSNANVVTLFVRDVSGNLNSANATVTVVDTLAPMAIGNDTTIYLDAAGNASVTGAELDSVSSDNCAIASYASSVTNFNCTHVGTPVPVVLTVTDVSGNSDTNEVSVTIMDSVSPTVSLQNISIYLDASGTASTTANALNNGSSDACGINSLEIQGDSVFDCQDVGANTVIVEVTDVNGNTATGSATVTVVDTIAPVAIAQVDTIFLPVTGIYVLDPVDFDNGSSDNCTGFTFSTDVDTVGCIDVGNHVPVLFTVTDSSGNATTVSTSVYVDDTIAPTPIAQDIEVYINASGYALITKEDIIVTLSDSCAVDTIYIDADSAFCSDVNDTITVISTAVDTVGNTGYDTSLVFVYDTILPTVFARDTLVYLDINGGIRIDSNALDSSSFDNCSIQEIRLSPDTFTCSNIGVNNVYLVVEDIFGNKDSVLTSVEVLDTIAPVAVGTDTFRVLNNSGIRNLPTVILDGGSWDNCGIDSEIRVPAGVNCSHVGPPISVLYTIYDASGNFDTVTSYVTVIDQAAPALWPNDTTLYLDTLGMVSVTAVEIDSSTSDACGVDSVWISKDTFTCVDVGVQTIEFSAIDVNGNSDTTTVSVTVLDTVLPTVVARDLAISLDATGSFTITADTIDSASYDNCSIDTIWLSQSTFDCSDMPSQVITLFVQDTVGNIDSVQSTITITDTIAPVVSAQAIDVYLDSSGVISIDTADLNSASTDNCAVDTMWLSLSSFDCADTNGVLDTLFAMDQSGNITWDTATVSVHDTVAPDLNLYSPVLYLDSNGQLTVTEEDFMLTSQTYDIHPSGLSGWAGAGACAGTRRVSTGSVETWFWNDILPTGMTIESAQIQLGWTESFVTTSSGRYFNGSFIDNSNAIHLGGCSVGLINVTLPASNYNSGGFNSFTWDRPVNNDIIKMVGGFGNAYARVTVVTSGAVVDNCSDTSDIELQLSQTVFGCADTGSNTMSITATDLSNNSNTESINFTILDNINPSPFYWDTLVLALDSFGDLTIGVDTIDTGSTDGCGIETRVLSQYDFDCSHVGMYTPVTLTLTDFSGNVTSVVCQVYVEDTLAPIIVSTNDTVYLDTAGMVSIDSSNVSAGTWDSCGVATITLDTFDFTCANTTSEVDVEITATDVYGNERKDTVSVLVLDTLRPAITCYGDIVVDNDSGDCGAIISFTDPTATDNCEVDTIIQTDATGLVNGGFFPIGVTTLWFKAIDVNGNEDSCSFTVTVNDTTSPVIVCQPDTVVCDSVFTFAMPVSSDNCPGDTITQIAGIPSGQAYPVGTTLNTFVASDTSGNTDTCSFVVTRLDYPSDPFAGFDSTFCDVPTYTLDADTPTVGVGVWSVISGGASITDTLDHATVVTGLTYGGNEFVWTISNGVCVTKSDTVGIYVDQTPTQAVLPRDTTLCFEDSFELVTEVPAVGVFEWTLDGDFLDYDTSGVKILITDMELGQSEIGWSISNGVCPVSKDSMIVRNVALPDVDLGEDVTAFGGRTVTLAPVVSEGTDYTWSPSELFSDVKALTPDVLIQSTTTIVLEVVSDSGCLGVDSVNYIVKELADIPTGITPNGDNINDVWNIAGLENYPEAEVVIFDQNGRELFRKVGYTEPWDGTFNGEALPRASYYWIIDLHDGINEPMKGIISVMK